MSYPWALVLIFLISYLIGSVNFAKIISWHGWHKDIEKEGSGNPGTMNVLRTHGAKAATLTLLLEVVKSGLTAWLCRYLTLGYAGFVPEYSANLVYFFSGLAIVLGSCFPFFGAVKGGKGVACAGGVFMFSDLWYVALALFVVGVIQILITEYGFISCLIYILGMAIATTVYTCVLNLPSSLLICLIVWAICILIYVKHYKNFYRLFTHTENKAGFKNAFKNMFKKKDKQIDDNNQQNS